MRIGMVAPLEMRVPPVGYGGTELVVSLLTEELVRRGHEVTLFASGDAETSARLVPVCPTHLRGAGRDTALLTLMNVVQCLERASAFDIIHNHTYAEGVVTAGLVATPVLTTLHGNLSTDDRIAFAQYRGWHCAVSHTARALLPPKERFAGVVYNAIDCASYPFNDGPREDYLLFLSRMSREKGSHLAIEVARHLRQRLVLAGNVNGIDRLYFETEVLPQVDGDAVVYVGEADYRMKRTLMAKASCLLAPISWPEPFGLFMVEAMACGTPVVALNRGAAPEVVSHGRTGFVVETIDEMAEAVRDAPLIRPEDCRRHVESRFDVPHMADAYLAAYQRVLAGGEASIGEVFNGHLGARSSA